MAAIVPQWSVGRADGGLVAVAWRDNTGFVLYRSEREIIDFKVRSQSDQDHGTRLLPLPTSSLTRDDIFVDLVCAQMRLQSPFCLHTTS
jgi:hypothetical protein